MMELDSKGRYQVLTRRLWVHKAKTVTKKNPRRNVSSSLNIKKKSNFKGSYKAETDDLKQPLHSARRSFFRNINKSKPPAERNVSFLSSEKKIKKFLCFEKMCVLSLNSLASICICLRYLPLCPLLTTDSYNRHCLSSTPLTAYFSSQGVL